MSSKSIILANKDFLITDHGKVYQLKSDGSVAKEMKPYDNGNGYLFVSVYCGNRKAKQFYIHRLVAENFLVKHESHSDVNHIDGNKSNNVVTNLEWMDHRSNIQHAIGAGLIKRGGAHKNAKLSDIQVSEMRAMISSGAKLKAISKIFGVSISLVSSIKNNKKRVA